MVTDRKDEQPLVSQVLLRDTRNAVSLDDTVTVALPRSPLAKRRSSFSQLQCHKYLRPSMVETVFQYTVRHVTELLSHCDPNLLIKWCENMMASDTHGIKLFTTNFLNDIRQPRMAASVLKMLSHYWTWSNHSVLTVLAQFSKLALDMLEEFGSRLNTTLPITDYPITSLAASMFPYDSSFYTVLIFECDQKLKHSLQLVYDMQSVITENCDITQHTLLLLAVSSNPTLLYWMIPKSVSTIINTKVLQCHQLLFSKGVMKIFIYPNTLHILDPAKTVWPYLFTNESVSYS